MRLATVAESKRIDQLAQDEFGLSSEVLMEAAGSQAAFQIEQSFVPEMRAGHGIGIVCGPGGNGADGLVVARHLHSSLARGQQPITVFLIAPQDKRTELFKTQLKRCKLQGIEVVDLEKGSLDRLSTQTLLVDAIFGVGMHGPVHAPYREVIERLASVKKPVVSLDTPSGVDADTGMIKTVAVKAAQTITFGLAKPGFFMNQGPAHVGRLRVLSIGFPRKLQKRVAKTCFAVGEVLAKKALPKNMGATAHKTDHGHALLLAGGPGMWGAGLLSSSSAYRIGAGYVTLASHVEPTEVLRDTPEIMTARADSEKLWGDGRKWTACGIGPGFGTGDETYKILKKLMNIDGSKVVVDADAITVVAAKKMFPLPTDWIMTPHAGELSRVIGSDAKTIESDRINSALEGAERTGCHVLLKGFRTVIAHRGRTGVILSGNSALGKAGTGDVLTGMITGLLAQKVEPAKAAACAAYLHGRIADEWVRGGQDRRSLEASDLRILLPMLLQQLDQVGRIS